MDPKETAKKLLYKHWIVDPLDKDLQISFKQAVNCAIITAKEVRENLDNQDPEYINPEMVLFYKMVIEELNRIKNQ